MGGMLITTTTAMTWRTQWQRGPGFCHRKSKAMGNLPFINFFIHFLFFNYFCIYYFCEPYNQVFFKKKLFYYNNSSSCIFSAAWKLNKNWTVSPFLHVLPSYQLFTQLLPKCFHSTSANFYIFLKNMGVVDVTSGQAHLHPYVLLYTPSGSSFADSSFFSCSAHTKSVNFLQKLFELQKLSPVLKCFVSLCVLCGCRCVGYVFTHLHRFSHKFERDKVERKSALVSLSELSEWCANTLDSVYGCVSVCDVLCLMPLCASSVKLHNQSS